MDKRTTKGNAGRSRTGHGFKICKNPTVHFTDVGLLPDGAGVTPAKGQPFLFAIARDAHTIFASWNIDWRSIFEKEIPVDRQVHLRAIDADGIVKTTVAVEPMSTMHYVTISGLHNQYRVEIGYFQSFDTWQSVATSGEVDMPPQGMVEVANVDLATIPFHVSFQQLTNLFGPPNGTLVARGVSQFQKRLLSRGQPNEPTSTESQILQKLNLSLPEMAAADHDFRKVDSERLARRVRATLSFCPGQSSSWIRSERRE